MSAAQITALSMVSAGVLVGFWAMHRYRTWWILGAVAASLAVVALIIVVTGMLATGFFPWEAAFWAGMEES